jgi:predicted Zn-dependent protease
MTLAVTAGCSTSSRLSPFIGTPSPSGGATSARSFEADHGGRVRAPDKGIHIRRIADRLLAASHRAHDAGTYDFIILASESPNAFSFSDRRIYLTSGLWPYLETDDLLAAIIAHELGHLIACHGQASDRCEQDRLSCEIEADRIAVHFLASADFDTEALPTLIRALADVQPPSWADSRVRALRKYLPPG